MNTGLQILFFLLLFEPGRIVFNPLFCPFQSVPFIVNFISFIFFSFCVFYKSIKEDKLIYSKKQCLLLFLFASMFLLYFIHLYLSGSTTFELYLKVKLFLWCFYFIVLKQFLTITDRRKLFRMIFYGLIFFAIFETLFFTLASKTAFLGLNKKARWFPYNPNYFLCLATFLCFYLCENIKTESKRTCILVSLIGIAFLNQRRFSFLIDLFLMPFLIQIRRRLKICFLLLGLGACWFLKTSTTNSNPIVRSLKVGIFNEYVKGYINETTAGDFLAKTFGKKVFHTDIARLKTEAHSFFITFFRDYNFIEKCIFLGVFVMTFSVPSFLFLTYCITMTVPLYFFIAFVLSCNTFKRKKS